METFNYRNGDYGIFLDSKEVESLVVPGKHLDSTRYYPFISSYVKSEEGDFTEEWLALKCSQDSSVANSGNGVLFNRLEENLSDINVFVFTPRLMKQEDLFHYNKEIRSDFETIYTQGFLMNRIEGQSKVYIELKD